MKFLQQAVKAASEPKISVIKLIGANVGGTKMRRPYTTIHASALTKGDFCARKVALLDITDKKEKENISTALQVTFDVGKAVGELVVEEWLEGFSVGHWRCTVCGAKKWFCKKPSQCEHQDRSVWRYIEVRFKDPESEADGSLDLLIDVGATDSKLMVYELKILNPDDFEKITMPLPEHRIRTSLYMGLIRKSDSPYADKINTTTGGVLYVSRAFGKKHMGHGGEILPFKEFYVNRDDASNEIYLAKAREVKKFREGYKPAPAANLVPVIDYMPAPMCPSPECPAAKWCRVKDECFSGEYPAS